MSHLERVIIELNNKVKGENVHIPYRDSLLTWILKDSLGGSCMTKMIFTISVKEEDIKQSIQTCRFAARVACIQNEIKKKQSD